MRDPYIYPLLVDNPPLHPRTERDPVPPFSLNPYHPFNTPVLHAEADPTPGVDQPSLVSSCHGQIEQLLFSFPEYAITNPESVAAYKSLIAALRNGTRFVVAHKEASKGEIETWFTDAGHDPNNIIWAEMASFVGFTDWAEDAYVVITDESDGKRYLAEPWEFRRGADALIADAVEEYSSIQATQTPLIFQGGNCLIGDDFWLLGRDYFEETRALFKQQGGPIRVPPDTADLNQFIRDRYSEYIDGRKEMHLIGPKRRIPIPNYVATREGGDYFLDLPSGGTGPFQPIFHIDMFITPVGKNDQGQNQLLVGSPTVADQILGRTSPYALHEIYNDIADELKAKGFDVIRCPLVHQPSSGGKRKLKSLQKLAVERGNEELLAQVQVLQAEGATAETEINIRDYHHITWNNCLVENSGAVGKNVYLPTFGHGEYAELAEVDAHMKSLWEGLGFTANMLGDFNSFAKRMGVVHCISKYLVRGS